MSLHPEPLGPVPDETARVARAAFPRGTTWLRLRDELGPIYDDASFAGLFPTHGQPAEAPWRLALVTVMQFAEGLSDRQAAEAVRARIDWKYALGLVLTDPGFHFSVLSAFRARLVAGSAEHLLLDALLAACTARGYLRSRGQQRTDSTHVLGVLRVLNRLELLAETLRAALNAVAAAAPDWVRARTPPAWFERYSRRIEDYRLPKGEAARRAYAELVGADGLQLLEAVDAPTAPLSLRHLPAIEGLRRTWIAHYLQSEGRVRLREPKDMPPSPTARESPYEPEARYGYKRGATWRGYKVHLTEACDDDQRPHLLTHVATTIATASDMAELAAIHQGLARVGLLPGQHLVDTGYVRARNLLDSQQQYGVDLLGPTPADHQWQLKAQQGFDRSHFRVDWDQHVVHCPQGHPSAGWYPTHTPQGQPVVQVAFAADDCTPCPVRAQCTRAKGQPRGLTLPSRAEYEAMQTARQRQATAEFAARYARRAGIEGTISQGARAFGLRQARYRGLHKVHLQHVATAAALNVGRLTTWLTGIPRGGTRCSRFGALALARRSAPRDRR
jgi:transposase